MVFFVCRMLKQVIQNRLSYPQIQMNLCPVYYYSNLVEMYCLVHHQVVVHHHQYQQHRKCSPIMSHWNCKLIIGQLLNRVIKCKIKAQNNVKTVLKAHSRIYRYKNIIFFSFFTINFCFTIQVYRLPLYPQAGDVTHGLIVNYATKEKKQKSKKLYI